MGMEQSNCCSYAELDDGTILISDIQLPEGVVKKAYLSPHGVSVIASEIHDPGEFYDSLRTYLSAADLTLYLDFGARYDPLRQTVIHSPNGDINGAQELRQYHSENLAVYSRDRLLLMQDKLIQADARARGYYVDSDGTCYVLRHNTFFRVSEHSFDRQFLLTAFGGLCGIHRFSMGKYISAIVYMLTCGLFLSGWLLDLLQLLCGFARDKKKAVILPPKNRYHKLFLLAPAFFVGLCAFMIYIAIVFRFLGTTIKS